MKPLSFLACACAVIAIAGCNSKQGNAATNAPVDIKPVPAPKGGDWTQIVASTPAGGFVMGNPDAKVKLVEYGSMTCPHCKAFEDEAVPSIMNDYVKTGQVSYEFRNYVRDAFDLTASLIARCNGAQSFFPMTMALYKDQENWVTKIQAVPQDQITALQNLPPDKQFGALAKIAGFQDWAAARGVPQAKSSQCLSDQNSINQLVQMTSDAMSQYPAFQGTPSFVINDKLVDLGTGVTQAGLWPALEGKIKQALSS